MRQLVAIIGPTASGKSALGVRLAKKFNGEIVSADSRQAYKGLDIGSGKITKKEMMGIPHHLLDVASPKRRFTAARYQKLALGAIKQIQARGRLPILVGGTPFYAYAVIDGFSFPEVKPNPKLRAKLDKLSVEHLLAKLQKLDPERAQRIEQKNKRRLIRALEIVVTTGRPVDPLRVGEDRPSPALMIGIKKSSEELKQRIHKRLLKRLKGGMLEEVRRLHESGLSWRRLEEFGLEYRFIARYLSRSARSGAARQQKIAYEEMLTLLERAINDFSRRQMTWFKKDPRIHWISSYAEAQGVVDDFMR